MDIIHRVGIKAPASKVYEALASVDGLSRWWTRDTSGSSDVGGRIDFSFRDSAGAEVGGMGMAVLELVPQESVRWRVDDGPDEWIGTGIDFALAREDDFTIVQFGHRGWRSQSPFMSHCSTKWATFLLSLRDFAETGSGRPAPDDLRIGNWH